LLVLCDLFLLSTGVASSLAMVRWHDLPSQAGLLSHCLFAAIVAAAFVLLMLAGHEYSASGPISRLHDTATLCKNGLFAYALALGLAQLTRGYFTGVTSFSLSETALHATLLLSAMFAVRYVLWVYQQRRFRSGKGLRKVLVAGKGALAADWASSANAQWWLGMSVVDAVPTPDPRAPAFAGTGTRPKAELSGIRWTCKAAHAEEVIVALDAEEKAAMPQLAVALAEAEIPFRIVPSLFEESFWPAKLAGCDGVPMTQAVHERPYRIQQEMKRFLDQVLALAALVISAPLFVIVALLIKLTSRGPVLYGQPRVGLNGHSFTMYKFRTMVRDADEQFDEVNACTEADGRIFKMYDDPRVIAVGGWLRRRSIDELPQFWNVLRGDMSIVGPRPPLPREVDLYETRHLHRLLAKPGITGLWQVSGRSNLGFEDMTSLDCRYIRDWSLGLDLTIMLKTVGVVLTGDGAY
jgi:exopolysaccharide biosynthesis polyprenyl glycosylphosphotransferase